MNALRRCRHDLDRSKKSVQAFKPMPKFELPDYTQKPAIPIRHIAVGFDGKEIDFAFYMNNQFASTFLQRSLCF